MAITGPDVILEVHAKLASHDLGQRRLSEARRTGEKHVIQRVAPRAGGVDENLEVRPGLRLADELGQPLRAQRKLACILVLFFTVHETCGHGNTLSRFARLRNSRGLPFEAELGRTAPNEFTLPAALAKAYATHAPDAEPPRFALPWRLVAWAGM